MVTLLVLVVFSLLLLFSEDGQRRPIAPGPTHTPA